MTKEDLKYIAKIIRRQANSKYSAIVVTPDYTTGQIDIEGLPDGVKAIDMCSEVKKKGIKVYDRGVTRVLVTF